MVAQEPNRNWKTGSVGTEAGPEPSEPLFRTQNRNRNHISLLNNARVQSTPCCRGPRLGGWIRRHWILYFWVPRFSVQVPKNQDDGKAGLGLRGVAVTTETAITAKNAKTVKTVTVASLSCILKDQRKEGKVFSRTAETVKTAKTVMKATPLKLNPPFPSSLKKAYFKGVWDLWTENRGAPKARKPTTTSSTSCSRPSAFLARRTL